MSSVLRVSRLLGLVVLVYALLRVPAGADPSPGSLAVLQLNMCGSACGSRLGVVADLEREMTGRGRQPFVVTLDEVCRGQYDRLLADLPYHGHFEPTVPHRCWDGSDYGIAVLVRSSAVAYLGSVPLPAPAGGEPRTVTCVRTTARAAGRDVPLVACATHLDTDPANTASQVAAVAAQAGRYPGAVVVGGDFNAAPGSPALRPMSARFVEADADGEAFTGGCPGPGCGDGYAHPTRKIDYVWLSRGSFTGVRAEVTAAPHSDHAPLWATAKPA